MHSKRPVSVNGLLYKFKLIKIVAMIMKVNALAPLFVVLILIVSSKLCY